MVQPEQLTPSQGEPMATEPPLSQPRPPGETTEPGDPKVGTLPTPVPAQLKSGKEAMEVDEPPLTTTEVSPLSRPPLPTFSTSAPKKRPAAETTPTPTPPQTPTTTSTSARPQNLLAALTKAKELP